MFDREKNLFGSYAAKRISRRDLLDGAAKLGVAGIAANAAFASSVSQAMAADFNWKGQAGKTVKLLLNKHPYVDAMIGDLEAFKSLTGMNVTYDIFPEDVYFDKVTAALSSKSDQYDAFMTGAYMTWTYGPAGWIEDLNTYIKDASKTNPAFNWEDVLPGLRASTAWDGVAGSELGSGKAKQWCIPWGYELNNIAYNRKIFDKVGSRSWASIHPGFLSAYSNFGQRDFVMEGGKLKAAMNTKASKDFHEKWVKMIQGSGPKNWSTYTWYQVGTDLGAGASGMIFDADILGYFMNGGDNKERGNLGYAPFAANPAATAPTPNVWIWSLAMSSFSKQKDAAWMFMQWATSVEHDLFGARKMDFVNPVRASVWKDSEFRDRIAKSYPGYLEQHDVSAPGAKIYFTAQPLFFDLTTEWAASLQKMVAKEVSVDEGLDKLADSINRQLKQAGLG